jgi:hypothetical protein
MKLIVFIVLLSTLLFSGCHQTDSLRTFRENHPVDLTLAFYPSTLRMVNLAKNEEYHQLIKGVEKGRYFKVNKRDSTQQAIRTLSQGLVENGYTEVMSIRGSSNDMIVYTLESQPPVTFILAEREKEYIIVEIKGMVNITKLPKLINSFNEDEEFLNIFSMYDTKKPEPKIEPDTTNNQPE